MPERHGAHAEGDAAPASFKKLPAAHNVQLDELNTLAYEPGEHAVHDVLPAFALKDPGLQAAHALAKDAPAALAPA